MSHNHNGLNAFDYEFPQNELTRQTLTAGELKIARFVWNHASYRCSNIVYWLKRKIDEKDRAIEAYRRELLAMNKRQRPKVKP